MRLVVLSLIVTVLLVVRADAAAGGQEGTDIAAIEGLYADWRTAVEASDIPSYLTALHPDVRLLPPGAPAIVGRDNYGEFLGPVFEMATYRIDVETAPVVQVLGDIAVAEYVYTVHLDLKDTSVTTDAGALTASRTTSRYFDVLRRDASGAWQVWRHGWQQMP